MCVCRYCLKLITRKQRAAVVLGRAVHAQPCGVTMLQRKLAAMQRAKGVNRGKAQAAAAH
jgi:hypothetical protein